jgi:hypothetical protein
MGPAQHDDFESIREELAGLRAELDAARIDRLPAWRRGLARIRRARPLTVVGIAALVLALPVAVSATHIFSDVPTSSSYHNPVSKVYGARLTGGCGSGRYCPNDPVTRGQMAAFLARGLGRAGDGVFSAADWAGVAGGPVVVAETDIGAGGGTGGTAHVFATGGFNAWTDEAGICPCEIQLTLYNPSTGESSPTIFDAIGAEGIPTDGESPGPFWEANATTSFLFTVPSGTTSTIQLVATIVPTGTPTTPVPGIGPTTEWVSGVQAVYVPFGFDGGNPVLPQTSGDKGAPRPRGSH